MTSDFYYSLNGLSPEEFGFIQEVMAGMTAEQSQQFAVSYSGKRQNAEELLLFIVLGFVGVSGVHRLLTGRVLLAIVYFFTGGLFFIGTIADLIRYKSLALEYNKKAALECASLVRSTF